MAPHRSVLPALFVALIVAATQGLPAEARGPAKGKPGASSACPLHRVASGQSLWTIARRYNVSVADIQETNGLKEGEALRVGRDLEIPTASCRPARRPTPAAARPPAWTQVQKTSAERGGNPCNTPDPGWGVYAPWSRAPSMGQMISPRSGGISRSGQFDVVFHFHGHEPVRKEWVQVMDGPVLVGIDLGIGSGPYAAAFRPPAAFERLVDSVEQAVAKKTGRANARVRKVGLSAWSAGYGAVGEILGQAYGKRVVDSVVLLDGLHCGYQGEALDEQQIRPFIEFARQAAAGRKFMFVSHSSIIPPDYASTTETANLLIRRVGGRAQRTRGRNSDPMGLELIGRYDRAGFHVRGYSGNDKMDHCAHIGLFRDILKVHIKRRWRSPRAT